MPEFIQIWAQAIAQFEGFNSAGTVAARNNNPGNLKFAGQAGASGADGKGFAIFPSTAAGWQALYNQLSAYVSEFPGYSLLQIMAHYLGQSAPTTDSQGSAFSYAAFVADALGVDTSTTLGALAGVTAAAASTPDTASPATDGSADSQNAIGLPSDGSVTFPTTGDLVGLIAAGGVMLWAVLRLF